MRETNHFKIPAEKPKNTPMQLNIWKGILELPTQRLLIRSINIASHPKKKKLSTRENNLMARTLCYLKTSTIFKQSSFKIVVRPPQRSLKQNPLQRSNPHLLDLPNTRNDMVYILMDLRLLKKQNIQLIGPHQHSNCSSFGRQPRPLIFQQTIIMFKLWLL